MNRSPTSNDDRSRWQKASQSPARTSEPQGFTQLTNRAPGQQRIAGRVAQRILDIPYRQASCVHLHGQRAEAMRRELEELLTLARWTTEFDLRLSLAPIRRYTSPKRGRKSCRPSRGAFQVWGETWHNSIVLVIGQKMER
jgi:hypothetical protein